MFGINKSRYDEFKSRLPEWAPETEIDTPRGVMEVDRTRRAEGAQPTTLGRAIETEFLRPKWTNPDEADAAERPMAPPAPSLFRSALQGLQSYPERLGKPGLLGTVFPQVQWAKAAITPILGEQEGPAGAVLAEASRPVNYIPFGTGVNLARGAAMGVGSALLGRSAGSVTEKLTGSETAGEIAGLAGNIAGAGAIGSIAKSSGIAATKLAQETDSLRTPAQRALRGAIEKAKPLQEENAALLHQFRENQLKSFWGSAGKGEAGARAGMAGLRGEAERATFTPLREALEQSDIDGLFNDVLGSQLRGFDKPTAIKALGSILDGRVPAPSEMAPLEQVFPGLERAMRTTGVAGKLPQTNWEKAVDIMSIPRQLKAIADLSATFRHGMVSTAKHPILGAKSFVKQVRAAFDSDYAVALDESMRSSDTAKLMSSYGRYWSPLESDAAVMSQREEQFFSNFAEHIPGLGAVVRGSNRAFSTYLNVMRHGIEEQVLKNWDEADRTPERLQQFADWLNHSTGRGDLGWFKDHAPTLNAAFFSPRYFTSRLQMNWDMVKAAGNITDSALRGKALDPVSKEIAGSALAFYGTGITALGAMKASGFDVDLNPNSANFGRFKVGNTWYDYWGGLAQDARVIAQMATGKVVSGRTGTAYHQRWQESMLTFLRNKLAPGLPTVGVDVLTGRSSSGMPLSGNLDPVANLKQGAKALLGRDIDNEKVLPAGELARQLSLLVAGDIYAGWQADKIKGALGAGTASGLGIGVTTIEPSALGADYATLSPSEKRARLASNPEAAQEISNEKLLRGGASGAYEGQKVERDRRLNAIPENLTGEQKRERMNEINQDYRTALDVVQKQYGAPIESASGPEEQALNDYYNAFTENEDGSPDYEATDQKRAQLMRTWTDEQRAYVEKETGSTDPRMRADLREIVQTQKDLEKAGYFDLRNRAWQSYTQSKGFNGGEDFYDYRDRVVGAWAAQLASQGRQPSIARMEARSAFDKQFRDFSEYFTQQVRPAWERANPRLAVRAVDAGYLKPGSKAEREYIDTLSRLTKP